MGTVMSSLFITNARVIYAAQATSPFTSSTELKDYQLDTVTGVEAGRRRGMTALGAGIIAGLILHIIFSLVMNSFFIALISMFTMSSRYGSDDDGFGWIFGFSTFLTILITVAVILLLLRPRSYLHVIGPPQGKQLAQSHDWPMIIVMVLLFFFFGPILGLVLIVWVGVRELGLFQASEAQLYASPANIDTITFDAGAAIIDAQSQKRSHE